jgi:hypothetical protein
MKAYLAGPEVHYSLTEILRADTSYFSHRMYLLISFRKPTPLKNGQLIVY